MYWPRTVDGYFLRTPRVCAFNHADSLINTHPFTYADKHPVMDVSAQGLDQSDGRNYSHIWV